MVLARKSVTDVKALARMIMVEPVIVVVELEPEALVQAVVEKVALTAHGVKVN